MLDVCGIGQGHTWGLRGRLYQWALFEIVNFYNVHSIYLFVLFTQCLSFVQVCWCPGTETE